MTNVLNEPEPQAVPQQPKSRGCLFGCLIAAGLIFAMVLCTGIGGYWFVTGQIAKYTSEKPLELPTVEYTPEKLAELQTRVKSFGDAVEGETPVETELILTADDINAMISADKTMRGKVYVKINDGQFSGDVSIPLDQIPGGKGRYFNGSASFNASMENGVLIVTLAGADVNGEQVPQHVVDSMAGENLAKDIYKNPDNAKVLRRFENIKIEGDKVILKLKPVTKAEVEAPTATAIPEPTAVPESKVAPEPKAAEPAETVAEPAV